jgi:aspartate aminotransferase
MLSKRAEAIKPSVTLAITARAKELVKQGRDVVAFAAGEPDFDTPLYIQDAAIKAIRAGKTRYTPGAGTVELRTAISNEIKNTRGVEYPVSDIMVSAGAKQAVANVVLALVDEGGEVIVPAPYWVSYPEMVVLADGKSVVLETRQDADFLLEPAALKKAINKRTRAIFLNTPSNPTGCVYTEKRLREIYDVLKGTDIIAISDEIYEKLVYGDAKHVSPLTFSKDAADRTVLISGVSKTYAMTGWRIGFAAGPKEIIAAAVRIQEHTTSSASSVSQAAALEAYVKDDGSVEKMRKAFDERRKYMVEQLCSMKGVECREPKGAFYAFPNVSAHYGRKFGGKKVEGSVAFCEALLETAEVAAIPGAAFGADGFVRFSYAVSMENIKRGMDRLRKFLA